MKGFWVGVVDAILVVLIVSLFFFSDSLLITFVMAGVLAYVVDNYLIVRKCYLNSNLSH